VVIPAPLLLLETLSKLFNRNAVRGCQQFSVNLYISKMPPSWLKTKWRLCPPPTPPTRLTSILATFFFVKQNLKGRHFDNVAGVQGELLVTLDSISVEDFRQCFQQRERPWDRCIQSQGQHFEGYKSFKLVWIF